MDLVEGMRVFVAVVDAGSFVAGAERAGISGKVASKYVAQLESHIGTRLLHRTTRTLSLTEAGANYHLGCQELLQNLEELESGILETESELRGTLRVAAPITYGEMQIGPMVAEFSRSHPELSVELHLNDRHVDLINEGMDVAVRIGRLADSTLVAKRLHSVEIWTVASPAYLKAHGTPKKPDDLKNHTCIQDANLRSGMSWSYRKGEQRFSVNVPARIRVNSARSVHDLAVQDVGIGLCPDYVASEAVRSKSLKRLFTTYETASLDTYSIYPSSRHLSPKVRVWTAFASDWFAN